jgi:hypothetical protein
MNLSNNFNYVGNKANIDIGEIVVDFGYKYEPEQVKYITVTDNFETWRTVPKKTIPNPYTTGGYVTIVPYVPKGTPTSNLYYQRRQLWINPIGGGDENIPLPEVTGKKWYLDTISFRAFDMHEFVPQFYPSQLVEKTGAIDSSELFLTDGWDTGINALIIGYNTIDKVTWATSPYTTVAYPDFQYPSLGDMVFRPEASPTYDPFIGVGKYGQNWSTFDTLNQSASRSGVVGGMLPSDWFPNQFSFNISGSNSPTGIVTGTGDMVFGSDMFTTNRQGASDWAHTSLPLQLSNMNIEINYPYLGVEVYGAGHYQYLYWSSNNVDGDSSIKGIQTVAPIPRTIAQYPIVCELIVVQR